MSRTTHLSAALFFALATQAAAAQAPQPPEQPQAVKQTLAELGIDSRYTITYTDENGRPINMQAFYTAVERKAPYWANAHSDEHTAKFTLQSPAAKAGKIKTGGAVPDFHLKLADGRSFDNASLLGHTTLVNFFFTTCAPCIAETPALNAYARRHPKQHLLAVTFDEASDVKTFVAKHKFSWPVLTDANALIDGIGVKGYPMFALIDANGKLRKINVSGSLLQKNEKDLTVADIERWVSAP